MNYTNVLDEARKTALRMAVSTAFGQLQSEWTAAWRKVKLDLQRVSLQLSADSGQNYKMGNRQPLSNRIAEIATCVGEIATMRPIGVNSYTSAVTVAFDLAHILRCAGLHNVMYIHEPALVGIVLLMRWVCKQDARTGNAALQTLLPALYGVVMTRAQTRNLPHLIVACMKVLQCPESFPNHPNHKWFPSPRQNALRRALFAALRLANPSTRVFAQHVKQARFDILLDTE